MTNKNLNDNLGNEYFEAGNMFLSKKSPKKIQVYVEGLDDIAFWRVMLMPYENEKRIFEIDVVSLDKMGKTHVLDKIMQNLVENSGGSLVGCVDSDYDYLLENEYTDTEKKGKAQLINSKKYVFQTYTYSTENLKCYAPMLKALCTKITFQDDEKMDFQAFFQKYSTIIYPLFLWNLLFYAKNEHDNYTIENFCKDISINTNEKAEGIEYNNFKNRYHNILDNFKTRIDQKVSEFEQKFSQYVSEIEISKNKLKILGLMPENTYFFVRGHDIFELTTEVIKPVCKELKIIKEYSIRGNGKSDEEKNNNLNAYKSLMNIAYKSHKIVKNKQNQEEIKGEENFNEVIKHALHNNYLFWGCFFFKKLEQKLNIAFR